MSRRARAAHGRDNAIMSNPKRKLPLVDPQSELTGKFPRGFEKAVRASRVGDAEHRAVVRACVTLSRESARRCLPPSVATEPAAALSAIFAWAQGDATSLGNVRHERNRLYERLSMSIEGTERALANALSPVPDTAPYFTHHVRRTMQRYVGLSVHYSLATTTETCDTVTDPLRALEVAKAFAAAMAYRNTGLGPCRDANLHQAATEQAAWENETLPSSAAQTSDALRLQLFHEYLGVHWKNAVDAHRLYAEQFLQWAFPS